jgi:hypothetical protein
MPDLDAAALDDFRTNWIRDKYATSPSVVMLSHYNRAVKAAYFSDAQIESIHDRIQTDYAEELQGVYNEKFGERLAAGDSDADAATAAMALKTIALYRLMRAECWEMQMMDPGFVGSIADAEYRSSLFKGWREQIARDRTFTQARTSPSLASVRVVVS